jgi:hypothetical protein
MPSKVIHKFDKNWEMKRFERFLRESGYAPRGSGGGGGTMSVHPKIKAWVITDYHEASNSYRVWVSSNPEAWNASATELEANLRAHLAYFPDWPA